MIGGDIALQLFLLINVFVIGVVLAFAFQHARAHFKPDKPEREVKKHLPLLPLDTRQRIIEEAEEDYQKVLHRAALELEKNLEATTGRLNAQLDKMGGGIVEDEMQRYKEGLDELRKETAQSIGSAQAEIESHQTELRAKLAQRQAEMDAKLAERQAELEANLAARTTEMEAEFKARQAEYIKKQEEIEAQLAQHQAELKAALNEREIKLSQHQAELDDQLVESQKKHAEKQAQLEEKLEQEMAAKREAFARQLDTKVGDTIAAFLTETLGHNVDLGAQTAYLTGVLEDNKDELIRSIRDDA